MSRTTRVLRVEQLDARTLNDEMLILFKIQLNNALQYMQSSWLVTFTPELQTILKFCFWKLPLQNTNSTIGQRLFDLEYRDCDTGLPPSKHKLHLMTFFVVGFPWLWERIFLKFLKDDLKRKVENVIEHGMTVYRLATFVNFLIFLKEAKYSTVLERILKLKCAYSSPQELREIQYEYLNRELLWHGFAELLTFILPLINVHYIKGAIKRFLVPFFPKETKVIRNLQSCAICEEKPIFPHEMGCSHVFCYYCIASNILADSHYLCKMCNYEAQGISSIKPLILKTATI